MIRSATPSGARSTSALIVCDDEPERQHGDQRGDSDRRGGVAPAEAGGDQREAGEHGEGGEDVGGEVQRVGFQRRALRLRARPAAARAPARR